MKILIKALLVFAIALFSINTIKAQSKTKKDTIYYLLDINRTPVNDRIISIDSEYVQKFYTINCPCLKSGKKPMFRCNDTKSANLGGNALAETKLITLIDLIAIVKKYSYSEFDQKYVVYFITSYKNGFKKNRAFLEEITQNIIIDYNIIKADTIKKH